MTKRIRKILTLLIIATFLAPWATPLAGDARADGPREATGAHYCNLSKGPCTHGEFCPTKHKSHGPENHGHESHDGHEEARHHNSGHHQDHHLGHMASSDEGAEGAAVGYGQAGNNNAPLLSSTCHGSADTPAGSTLSAPMPFVTSIVPAPTTLLLQLSALSDDTVPYKGAYHRLPEQPPKTYSQG